ncbi:MAG: FkbM family methyltransferase, partial [Bacteroidota bacterium]
MKLVNLPNGLSINALGQIDTKVLYHEMFQMQTYLKYNVQVSDRDYIFDVGANIGLFSLSLTQSFQKLKIFAFEPIPEIFNALTNNAKCYFPGAVLCNVGLSNTAKISEFNYSPALTMGASMYSSEIAKSVSQEASVYDWMKAVVLDLHRISELNGKLTKILIKLLSTWGIRSLLFGLLSIYISRFLLFEKKSPKQVNCELKTVSEVIRENQVCKIDLLKVDVEGSELDVLRGIDQEDWGKI